MQRSELLRRAAILERAAELCEQNWAKLDSNGVRVTIGPGECWCAWTAIGYAAGPGGLPDEWRGDVFYNIVHWNDAQPGPEPVVAHLRASARRYREAAACAR